MSNFFKGLVTNTGVLGEILMFLWSRKFYWMIPMIVVLLLFGALVLFSGSAAAPFIYTLF